MTPDELPFDQRAWSWVSHLRTGGTTPWSAWAGRGCEVPARRVPGAAQLELLRRLARLGGDSDGFPRLADSVLALSGPGRGLPELPLPGAPLPEDSGPRPVDPGEIPAAELIRVAEGVVVAQVLSRPAVEADPRPPRVRRWPWQPAYRLVGAPVTTERIAHELTRAGLPPGGRRPRVIVVGLPFDRLMAEVWGVRVQHTSGIRWPRFWARWRKASRLPVSADLPGLARHWADKVGRSRVELVLADDPVEACRLVSELVGRGVDLPAQPPLSAESLDLLRGINRVLSVAVPESRQVELLRSVLPSLVHWRGHATLTAPAAMVGWARARAREMTDDLNADGYAVHGRPGVLVPEERDDPDRPDDQVTLEIAVRACLRAAGCEESS